VSVAFTEWLGAMSYVITSVPDGIVVTGALSPITMVGLNATTLHNGRYKDRVVGRNAVGGIETDAVPRLPRGHQRHHRGCHLCYNQHQQQQPPSPPPPRVSLLRRRLRHLIKLYIKAAASKSSSS
jgi:hypothetical protein